MENLTKDFGSVRAVDQVSFNVKRGEILGFLGPNGAGKTTTMRILTGYLPATSGTARIAGFEVFGQSMEVRRRIGYQPENPPLYPEMTVEAYLDFVARIKGVPARERARRVTAALDMTRTADKRRELIHRLSRGYKQRVGLAQALVHDPEVIILDEPTAGLDPKQIAEVRSLIKGLSGGHTIILSTHILPEVSATCDRVVIIHRGKIVAEDTTENLTRQLRGGEAVHLLVEAPELPLRRALESAEGVRRVTLTAAGPPDCWAATVESERGLDLRAALAARIVAQGFALLELRAQRRSLEEIFLELTTEEPAAAPEAPPAGERA